MSSRVKFVGRKKELALIGRFGQRRMTSDGVFIHGEGGIGKTRLLYEIQKRVSKKEVSFLVTNILDFNRPEMRTVEGVRQEIIESIGYSPFGDYLRAFGEWQRIAQIQLSSYKHQEEAKKLEELFIGCLNNFSGTRRVIILVDTVDEVTDVDIENIRSMRGLRNVLWVFAGRKSHTLAEALIGRSLFNSTKVQELKPLDKKDSEIYLLRKQRLIHITLEREWVDKLILLTSGKPVLLDLAVDWIARNIDIYAELPFGQSYAELCRLSEEELEQLRAAFEQHLVYRIAERRTLWDRLFVVLAQVYPLDTKGIAEFLQISEEEAQAVMKEARTYSFVKEVADERIELHDEMFRMVNAYVWVLGNPGAGIDPSGKRRAYYYQQALSYFGRLASEQKQALDQLQKPEPDFGTAEQRLDYFWQRETLEGQFWGVVQKQLYFANQVHPEKGADLFIELFDYAASSQNVLIRKQLLEQMPPDIDTALPLARKYEFLMRKGQQFSNKGDYPAKKALLLELARAEGLSPAQGVNIFWELGNTLIRMAEYVSAAAYLGQAVQISRRDGLTALLARSTNALGWCYRLMGKLDDALDCYGEALLIATDHGDEQNQALILNNMGYVYALRRNLADALDACRQALALWEHLNCRDDQSCEEERKRNIGVGYGTVATILTEFGQFEESLRYREIALGMFEKGDLERLSSNYLTRGITYWLMGNVQNAKRNLEEARSIGLDYEQHKIAHYLAHIAEEEGNYDEAARLFSESRQRSQSLPDPFYELNNLGDLAHLAVCRRDFSELRDFEDSFTAYQEKWGMVRYDLPEGLLCKYIGDLALGAGQRERASGFYQQGLPLIASAGGYGPYTLARQLQDTADLFQDSQPELLFEVGTAVRRFWLEQKLERRHPQILSLLAKWKRPPSENDSNE